MLIVDDHLPTREQIREFLISRGVEVRGVAADGEEAIAKVKELSPSVVILDVYMPHVNGVAAAYEIRRISPHTKIIFFSNYETPKHPSAHRLFGGDAFVSKASGVTGLLAALSQYLPPK